MPNFGVPVGGRGNLDFPDWGGSGASGDATPGGSWPNWSGGAPYDPYGGWAKPQNMWPQGGFGLHSASTPGGSGGSGAMASTRAPGGAGIPTTIGIFGPSHKGNAWWEEKPFWRTTGFPGIGSGQSVSPSGFFWTTPGIGAAATATAATASPGGWQGWGLGGGLSKEEAKRLGLIPSVTTAPSEFMRKLHLK